MRFYNGQHRYFCGVDLHTKRMYLCILDHEGNTRLHRNVRAKPHDFHTARSSGLSPAANDPRYRQDPLAGSRTSEWAISYPDPSSVQLLSGGHGCTESEKSTSVIHQRGASCTNVKYCSNGGTYFPATKTDPRC
jgi:hypothetical protein